jgi:hypothetical protein
MYIHFLRRYLVNINTFYLNTMFQGTTINHQLVDEARRLHYRNINSTPNYKINYR